MKKYLLLILIVLTASCAVPKKQSFSFRAMGTLGQVTVYTANPIPALSRIRQVIERNTHIFNRYNPQSEVSRFNEKAGTIAVSPALYKLLKISKEIYQITGVFEITLLPLIRLWDYKTGSVPSQKQILEAKKQVGSRYLKMLPHGTIRKTGKVEIDPGGIAKGWIIDRCADELKEMNIEKGLVEIGGDLFGFGKIWTVGILDPKTRKPLYRLKIKNRAVMTSGDYERFFKKNGRIYSHILDPRTGRPALVKAHSVTVIGPEAAVADALATAFFILGEKKSFQILENFYPGYSAFFILPNQSTVKSIYFPYTLERIRNNL